MCLLPPRAARTWRAPARWLTAQNFSFKDVLATINSTAGAYAGCFVCALTRTCSGFRFDGVVVSDVAPTPPPALPSYVCGNVGFMAIASAPVPCAG